MLIGDDPKPTQHSRIMIVQEQYISWLQLEVNLNSFNCAISENSFVCIRKFLEQTLVGYNPNCKIVDFVYSALVNKCVVNDKNGLSRLVVFNVSWRFLKR